MPEVNIRVPTTGGHGWTVETLLDLVTQKERAIEQRFQDLHVLLAAHDRRYSEGVEADRRAIDAALIAQKEAVTAALEAADRAVAKAETASEKRFEGVNEFRAQLGDQQRTLMPRMEAEIRFNGLASQIDALNKAQIVSQSQKLGLKDGWGWAVGALGIIVTVITVLTRFIKP